MILANRNIILPPISPDRPIEKIIRIVIILSLSLFVAAVAEASELELADDGLSAGYATLGWPTAEGTNFILQQQKDGVWQTLYEGGDRATTLSGLSDGNYRFRLMVDGTRAGVPVEITVAHHPLGRAWTFFAVGAVMFLLLLAMLIMGTRQTNHPTQTDTLAG